MVVDVSGVVDAVGEAAIAVGAVGLAVLSMAYAVVAWRQLREVLGGGGGVADRRARIAAMEAEAAAARAHNETVSEPTYRAATPEEATAWLNFDRSDPEVTVKDKDLIDPGLREDYEDESRFRATLSDAALMERDANFDEYGHRRVDDSAEFRG